MCPVAFLFDSNETGNFQQNDKKDHYIISCKKMDETLKKY